MRAGGVKDPIAWPEDSLKEIYSVRKNCQCFWKWDWFVFLTLLTFSAHQKDNQSFKNHIQGIHVKFFEWIFFYCFCSDPLADTSDFLCLVDVPQKVEDWSQVIPSELCFCTKEEISGGPRAFDSKKHNCTLEEINVDLLTIMICVKNWVLCS